MMNMKRGVFPIVAALVLLLVPLSVSADELWVENQGGLEIVVDGSVTDVQYDGLYAWNPEYSDGQAKVAAVDLKSGTVVIYASGAITSYDIEVACNQKGEDITPTVTQVIDYNGTRISFDPTTTTRDEVIAALDLVGPPPPPPDSSNCDVWVDPFGDSSADTPVENDGGGQSIASMNAAADDWVHDWSGQEIWLYT
ncbi:MAG: hypothetical protein WC455_25240 [Dehalococcoidia bacterium]|jgi:hypothetical protein